MSNLPASNDTASDQQAPDSGSDQAKVDRLITHINEQIELLAFDDPEPALLKQIIEALADQRKASRIALIEALSEIGDPATPFLLAGLASNANVDVRRACCNALTNIGDEDAVPGLIEALKHDAEIGVKSAAAAALAKIGKPAFEALCEVLSSETSESCKGHAAWAIASMSAEVSEQLYDIISSPSEIVRTAAVSALAQLLQQKGQSSEETGSSEETNRAIITLMQALEDSSSEVRIEAAATLARLSYQPSYDPLVSCLQDSQADVRKAVMMALAKLGNRDAIAPITPLQQDADPSVQRMANLVIAQLEAKSPAA